MSPKVCIDKFHKNIKDVFKASQLACAENPNNASSDSFFHPFEAVLATDKKWAIGRVIKCKFLAGSPTQQKKVEEQAHKIEEFANLQFKFVKSGTCECRINFDTNDGSWSFVGTDNIGVSQKNPTMSYGWLSDSTDAEEYERVVVHEFLHLASLYHEHQNPSGGIEWNKDVVYKYYMETQGWTKEEVDLNLFLKYSTDHTQFTQLDPLSIMMYPINSAFTLNGFSSGWNTTMSPTDKEFLSLEYPKIPLLGINEPSKTYMLAKDEPIDLQLNVPSNQSNLFLINTDPKHVWLSVFDGNTEKSKKIAWGKGSAQFNSSGAKYIVRARFEKDHEGAFSIWCSKPGSI
jgi:hypothetical protein